MCLSPNWILKKISKRTGEVMTRFMGAATPSMLEHPEYLYASDRDFESFMLPVPCQKCAECYANKSAEWAFRCSLEFQCHNQGCILTLTYDDEHNPQTLVKRDYQSFLRDLRKKIYPQKVRYFISGEYGSLTFRPHFHCILFGFCPNDLVFYKKSKSGLPMYNSDFLSSIWKRGFVTIEAFSLKGAMYSAKYFQKYLYSSFFKNDDPMQDFYLPPFIAMSTHPGIGAFSPQAVSCLKSDQIYADGRSFKTPRYFLKLADRRNDPAVGVLRQRRENDLISRPQDLLEKKFRANSKYFQKKC